MEAYLKEAVVSAVCLLATLQLQCAKGDPAAEGNAFPYSREAPPAGMVFIEGGTFSMGNLAGRGFIDEYPVHDVTVSSFFMDSTEVTCEQFNEMGKLTVPCDSIPGHPYHERDWFAAARYCNWRSLRDGLQPVYEFGKDGETQIHYDRTGYRLPTEAQWEYACRAGTTTRYYWGDGLQGAEEYECVRKDMHHEFRSVATRKPNPWGLYDMLGNVLEWCNDWYHSKYYEHSRERDPTGPLNGNLRVVRGGMCSSYATCSFRSKMEPREAAYGVGFRCVLQLHPADTTQGRK